MNSPINVQSFYFFLRLNVRMIFVLLQVLLPELDDPITGEDLPNSTNEAQPGRARDNITAITRRILPALRQYSTWLVSEAHILVANHPGSTSVYIKELWKMYADVVTGLATFFAGADLPDLNYLLEEDQTTVGFKPLRDPNLKPEANLYIDEKGLLKARCIDPGVERSHPNIEMQARVRDVLLCGLTLASREDCPLVVESGRVVYVEEGLRHISPVTAHTAQGSASSHTRSSHQNTNFGTTNFALQQQDDGIAEGSVTASESQHSMDTDMHRMVDDLLEPSSGKIVPSNETSYGMHSHTANEVFAPMANSNLQHLRQTTPKMLPSLPPLWNSPFTPQPNELQLSSPDRPTTARQVSPLQLSKPQQKLGAAAALNEMTSYGPLANSWGRKASKPPEMSAPINEVLQQPLAPQFRPMSMSSSAFADSSSIYANSTPHRENRLGGGHLRNGPVSTFNGNNSTIYAGASDFDKNTMLQSTLWNCSEAGYGGYMRSPPGGQGG
jgi:hypothetical protein